MPERDQLSDRLDGPHEGCAERACECVQAEIAAAEKGRDYYSQCLAETQAENRRLRDGFCDEAYILMVQALDVKALPKGRKRILTEQAIRMAKIGLSEGQPRPQIGSRNLRQRLARDVLAQLSAASDEEGRSDA